MKNKILNFAIGALIGTVISVYAANQRVSAEQPIKEYPIGTPVVKVVEVIETDKPEYFNVPLSHDIQDHIFEVCEEYGIAPALVVAMIAQESDFRADQVGDDGSSAGLLQVQQKWHQERMATGNYSDYAIEVTEYAARLEIGMCKCGTQLESR